MISFYLRKLKKHFPIGRESLVDKFFFESCLFQRVKNFNYSGQLKHREETTIKISIQCEVLIAWWLWLKFEKTDSERNKRFV